LSSIYLLYQDTVNGSNSKKKEEVSTFDWSVGIVALLVAAITEAAYFLYFLQQPLSGSWNRLAVSYIGAAVVYAAYYGITRRSEKQPSKKPRDWLFAILWNIAIAGFGYWGRFYSMDKVEPIVYTAISYTGLIGGYLFSVLFGLDAVTKVDIVAIAGVLFSILGLSYTPVILGANGLFV
jgi:drug/metabolite transporter (DMT)-like permease